MTMEETLTLQRLLISKYGDSEIDTNIIKTLCFASNVADKIAQHFNNTNNKVEFYRSILKDQSLNFSVGYETLYSAYSYLI